MIDLGIAYDPTVDAQDLAFRYRNDVGKFFDGLVEYIASPIGDLNGDGTLTNADIAGFVSALTDPASYASQYPGLNPDILGDFTGYLCHFRAYRSKTYCRSTVICAGGHKHRRHQCVLVKLTAKVQSILSTRSSSG